MPYAGDFGFSIECQIPGPTKYRVWYTNFSYFKEKIFYTLEAAVEAGKRDCFEFRVDADGQPVASWSPIGGLRRI